MKHPNALGLFEYDRLPNVKVIPIIDALAQALGYRAGKSSKEIRTNFVPCVCSGDKLANPNYSFNFIEMADSVSDLHYYSVPPEYFESALS